MGRHIINTQSTRGPPTHAGAHLDNPTSESLEAPSHTSVLKLLDNENPLRGESPAKVMVAGWVLLDLYLLPPGGGANMGTSLTPTIRGRPRGMTGDTNYLHIIGIYTYS